MVNPWKNAAFYCSGVISSFVTMSFVSQADHKCLNNPMTNPRFYALYTIVFSLSFANRNRQVSVITMRLMNYVSFRVQLPAFPGLCGWIQGHPADS